MGMAGAQHNIYTVRIKDKNHLYTSYMPFVSNGGLFIATSKSHQFGDEVFVMLTLPDEMDTTPVVGHVVWITPEGAGGNRPSGIGIQFLEMEGKHLRAKIETNLAGALKSERPTYTM